MKVVVTGATGFIGGALVKALLERGDQVVALTRDVQKGRQQLGAQVEVLEWHPPDRGPWMDAFNGADAVVNLAGTIIAPFPRRWTAAYKASILSSRLDATNAVVQALVAAHPRPSVLVNASGMDFYEDLGDTPITEEGPPGSTFLATVGKKWEAAGVRAEEFGVRVVLLRTSFVLGSGRAVSLLTLPFRLFVGGPPGSPKQWFSWIHIDDEIGIILYALTHENVNGPINAAAPNPVQLGTFARDIGRALHRPSWLPVPPFLMRLVLGEQANILLISRRVIPRAIEEAGYRFRYPESAEALRSALRGSGASVET